MNFQRLMACATAVALALAAGRLAASPAAAADQGWESLPVNPRVSIEYAAPRAERLKVIYQYVQKRRVLEELQHFFAPLHLPHRLLLQFLQCDQVNAFYSPAKRSLLICYEMIESDLKSAPATVTPDGFITRQGAVIGDLVATALHETGHMLFDMLDVPVFGREEDAADEMAHFIALQFNKDVARLIVKGDIYYWANRKDPQSMASYSDVHGTASQRMYNGLCLDYGADPETFKEYVDKGYLPKKRAEHCAAEYALVTDAFIETVMPFLDQEILKRVQEARWFTEEEMK